MKKITYISTLLILALLIIYVPFTQAYDNTEYNFSIDPPSGWTTKEGVQGVVVQFVGPVDPVVGAVNVNIAVIETDLTLEGVVTETKQHWSSNLDNYELISERSLTINGHAGYELKISFDVDGDAIRQDSVLFVENDQLYQVSYVASPAKYNTYFNLYDTSLQTFKIESSTIFSFNFEITGLPFIILVVTVVLVIVIIIVLLSRRKKTPRQLQTYPPPPPPV